jgi:hypothetical protein
MTDLKKDYQRLLKEEVATHIQPIHDAIEHQRDRADSLGHIMAKQKLQMQTQTTNLLEFQNKYKVDLSVTTTNVDRCNDGIAANAASIQNLTRTPTQDTIQRQIDASVRETIITAINKLALTLPSHASVQQQIDTTTRAALDAITVTHNEQLQELHNTIERVAASHLPTSPSLHNQQGSGPLGSIINGVYTTHTTDRACARSPSPRMRTLHSHRVHFVADSPPAASAANYHRSYHSAATSARQMRQLSPFCDNPGAAAAAPVSRSLSPGGRHAIHQSIVSAVAADHTGRAASPPARPTAYQPPPGHHTAPADPAYLLAGKLADLVDRLSTQRSAPLRHLPKVNAPTFDGAQDSSFETWRSSLEDMFTYLQWPPGDPMRLNLLPTVLTDAAKLHYDSLPAADKATYIFM